VEWEELMLQPGQVTSSDVEEEGAERRGGVVQGGGVVAAEGAVVGGGPGLGVRLEAMVGSRGEEGREVAGGGTSVEGLVEFVPQWRMERRRCCYDD
jgi:hypothetical protein